MSENNSNSQKSTEDKVTATLVSLEEDDEFEDFPVEGMYMGVARS